MPHRAMNIVFALAGAIALIAMILVGMDIFASARKGGKWKRRILTAGLLLLGLNGFSCQPTCYIGILSVSPASKSVQDLSARMELLEKLSAEEKLNEKVVDKILINIKEDLALLNDPENLNQIPGEQKRDAEQTREQAEKLIKKIMLKMKKQKSEWKQIISAYKDADEFLEGKRDGWMEDKRILNALEKAQENCGILAEEGIVTKTEAELLKMDIVELINDIGKYQKRERRR